ncbi:hypothetical protein GUITHDRAFT_119928 [Guillardia theta CCMP2712]|uniref:FHA domain-containing protein n=1 Tax=Guillardia theta (strain CCMP2712) TaxID=905079 RepID=L1ICD8_GUITC|nr:hypothetical protein GUITHDRAFT_119928 [Guillardia theta CCMP2712]EKX33883.1 hypothetical protein GUITHDRAFT_119928 [Guillardia theta CCMP2712]|eukprot:XP_005820863.1 hypothetical protein GUITHDRAFT_119928 [Guillardia theta CCMP2712]
MYGQGYNALLKFRGGDGEMIVCSTIAMAWNAGPAMIAVNKEGLQGRCGVGGGAAWKRVAGKVDSRMHARGNLYAQQDLGKVRDEEQEQYFGDGWGKGHAWPEGGQHRKESFQRNAGWIYDGRSTKEEGGGHGAAVEEQPAVGARAILQVFRSMQKMPGEIRVGHTFTMGRDKGCSVPLDWDGVSRHHLTIQALESPDEAIRWFILSHGTNGTFVNGKKIADSSQCALKDGDVIGLGKGRIVKVDGRIEEKELLYQVAGRPQRRILSRLLRADRSSFKYQFVFRNPFENNSSYVPPQNGRVYTTPASSQDDDKGEINFPCKSAVFQPSWYKNIKTPGRSLSNLRLELDYVYSFSSGGRDPADVRSNVKYLIDGRIVYPAGSMGVVFDPISNTQEYFTDHDGFINVLALHPNKRIVATGGVATWSRRTAENKPSVSIFVWDSCGPGGKPTRISKPFARQHEASLQAMSFSTSGEKLVTVGGDSKNKSRVIVYETTWLLEHNPFVLESKKKLSDDVMSAQRNVYWDSPPIFDEDGLHFAQTVDRLSRVWNYKKFHKDPTKSMVTMGGVMTPQRAYSIAWIPPSWFPSSQAPLKAVPAMGLQLGDIFMFDKVGSDYTVIHKIEQAHSGEILCLRFIVKESTAAEIEENGIFQYLLSGGRDGKIRAWDAKLSWREPVMEVDLRDVVEDGLESVVAVRSLDYNPRTNKLIAATSMNSIFEIDLSVLRERGWQWPFDACKRVMNSHFGSVESIARWPSGDKARRKFHAASTSRDGFVRMWDCEARTERLNRYMGMPGLSIDVSSECLDEPGTSEALQFSPDCKILAVISGRRQIHTFDCIRYSVPAPQGQEEVYFGDGKLKEREKQLREKRHVYMLAHKGNENKTAPKAVKFVGSKLKPEPFAAGLIRNPPTDGIVHKIGAKHEAPRADALKRQLPVFKHLCSSVGKHATTITNMDFSADSRLLRTSDNSGELLYWNVANLTSISRAGDLRDVRWANFSVPFMWELKGIWEGSSKPSNISVVDAQPQLGVAAVALENHQARSPLLLSPSSPACSRSLSAAFRVVTRWRRGSVILGMTFTNDSKFLLTCGSLDNCVLQWRNSKAEGDGQVNVRAGASSFPILTRADD